MSNIRAILDMNVEELKTAITAIGRDPQGLAKPALQEILVGRLLGATPPVADDRSDPTPLFVNKLSPELQLQWWMKHEEAKQAALAIEK
jgi:hypothetical protein